MTKEDEKCPFCRGKNVTTLKTDVGWDMYEGGEEIQHIEECKCGAYRYVFEDVPDGEEKGNYYYGNWQKYEK